MNQESGKEITYGGGYHNNEIILKPRESWQWVHDPKHPNSLIAKDISLTHEYREKIGTNVFIGFSIITTIIVIGISIYNHSLGMLFFTILGFFGSFLASIFVLDEEQLMDKLINRKAKIDGEIIDLQTIDLPEVHPTTIINIVKILNTLEEFDKIEAYNTVLHDLNTLNPIEIENTYSNEAMPSGTLYVMLNDESKINKERMQIEAKNEISRKLAQSQKDIIGKLGIENDNKKEYANTLTNNVETSGSLNGGDLGDGLKVDGERIEIEKLIEKDSRLTILHSISNNSDKFLPNDMLKIKECIKLLYKCALIIDGGSGIASEDSLRKELEKFHEIVDSAMPVFTRAIDNAHYERDRQLNEASTYMRSMFGTTHSIDGRPVSDPSKYLELGVKRTGTESRIE